MGENRAGSVLEGSPVAGGALIKEQIAPVTLVFKCPAHLLPGLIELGRVIVQILCGLGHILREYGQLRNSKQVSADCIKLVDAEKPLNQLFRNGLLSNYGTVFALKAVLLLVKPGKTHEAEAFVCHHSARLFSD